LTNAEIETAWNNARNSIWVKHIENNTQVIFEQEEKLRVLNRFLKGFKYYENI